ncbi:MAG: phosphotransferase [Clostridia bacterium]|nr:phosphotransferase [Clostridia bacterium]
MSKYDKIVDNIKIDDLSLIGRGANGSVYQLDEDKIIKVYNDSSLERIKREKDAARKALIHGIPTAISYNIAKIGDKYGIIYECVNSQTLGQYLDKNPDKIDDAAKQMANLLKKLHSTEFEPGVLPDARDNLNVWADIAEKSGYYSDEVISKMRDLIYSIHPRNTFIHGDFHPGNIMVTNGEMLLIDMTDSSVGDPIVDLMGAYQIMKLVSQREGGGKRYTGMSNENLNLLWDKFIGEYTGITDKDQMIGFERKLKFYSLIRSLPGVTFSDLVPKDKLPFITGEVSQAFLTGYELFTKDRNSKEAEAEEK